LSITLGLVGVRSGSVLAQDPAGSSDSSNSPTIANPVPEAGGRINIWDPTRGQGGGYFDASRGNRPHTGVDLTADQGTPVQAVEDGVVTRSVSFVPQLYSTPDSPPLPVTGNGPVFDGAGNRLNAAGNRVAIQHLDGTSSYYYHLRGDNQPVVGDRVVAGQVIGEVGRSGNVPQNADTHLHFEFHNRDNVPVQPNFSRPQASVMQTEQLVYDENAPRASVPDQSSGIKPRQIGVSASTAEIEFPK
jgi:murein DD-endopeptidase MepM/ murein hydrolase activator NlpD